MSDERLVNPELAACEVHGMSRAGFLLRGAMAAGSVYGVAAVGPFVSSALAQSSSEGAGSGSAAQMNSSDAEILNFALTLEYLESDFYNVKGKQVGLSGQAKSYAKLFGEEESQHVEALTAAIKQLGGKPVAKPTFVFPANNEKTFLALAAVLENTGVGAYNGAAPSLHSKQVLAEAGEIVQIEARHAAAIELLLGHSPTPTGGFDVPLTKPQVLAKAGPLIKS